MLTPQLFLLTLGKYTIPFARPCLSFPQMRSFQQAIRPGMSPTSISKALPYAWSLGLAALVLYAAYPGFMSWDSLYALREARGQVAGGAYPPLVSYVWRVLDLVWPGPSLMLLVQNSLLLLSVVHILRIAGFGIAGSMGWMTLFVLSPAVLGPMMVVWKDVGVSACFAAATAVGLELKVRRYPQGSAHQRLLAIVALAFVFFGMAYRLNAFSAALPILGLIFLSSRQSATESLWQMARKVGAATIMAFLVIFAAVYLLNNFRLPSLERLGKNQTPVQTLSYDLFGISAVGGTDLEVSRADGATLRLSAEYSEKTYSPRHFNLIREKDEKGLFLIRRLWSEFGDSEFSDEDVLAAWLTAVREHPGAYFAHRSLVFSELVGATDHDVYCPTHPAIDENEFGITHSPSRFSELAVRYVIGLSGTPLSRPWIYYLAGFLLAVAAARSRGFFLQRETVLIYLSSVFYILPFFFITPAADLRYNHWAVVAAFLAVALGTKGLQGRLELRR